LDLDTPRSDPFKIAYLGGESNPDLPGKGDMWL
jgi:hypothetical protein